MAVSDLVCAGCGHKCGVIHIFNGVSSRLSEELRVLLTIFNEKAVAVSNVPAELGERQRPEYPLIGLAVIAGVHYDVKQLIVPVFGHDDVTENVAVDRDKPDRYGMPSEFPCKPHNSGILPEVLTPISQENEI